jgi:ubiquinone/menaquinone biosynthesis C-methylase UbiE
MPAPLHNVSSTASEASSNRIYDRLADTYGYAVDGTAGARLKYLLVLRYVSLDARVLDVGCANGLHIRKIAPHCREIVGIDINARMLDLAKTALLEDGAGNAAVFDMSATRLEFDAGTFDVAYSFSTLTLIPAAEAAIREISRVLRPGGTAILDMTGRRNLAQRHWDRWYRSEGHPGVRSFTWRQARTLMTGAGLDVVEAPALGFLDQWRYLPVLRRATGLDALVHRGRDTDLDFAMSNLRPLRRLANRWYVVARKRG